MGVFKYDLVELSSVSSGLTTLKNDYENASRERGDAHGALGYGSLQNVLGEFVDNWKHERSKQLEAIQGSSQVLQKTISSYVEYDEDAAEQLREDCQP